MTMEAAPKDLLESGHGVRFSAPLERKLSFGENIEKQRIAVGLTQAEAAKLVPISARTWRRWETDDVTPPLRTQAAAFKVLDKAAPEPSKKRKAKLRKSHHLYWEKHKGWFTRVTISMGTKVVGKRVKIRLYTKDETTAIERRPVVIAAYKKLGLVVVTRLQKATKRC